MLIQSNDNYKSLDPINPPIDLPDLVVLSGVNGAGKSQLLEAISGRSISITEHDEQLEPIILFNDRNSLEPNQNGSYDYTNLRSGRQNILKAFINYKAIKAGGEPKPRDVRNITIPPKDITIERYITGSALKAITAIANTINKDIDDLNEEDILYYYPVQDYLQHTGQFYHHNLPSIFKHYQLLKYENDVRQFRSQKYADVSALSDEEFLNTYGEPPWMLVNKILHEANLDYQTNYPAEPDPESPFILKLINNLNGEEIDFTDLSSGEKVIMSLALSLYNSRFEIEFPKLLLMDEPDAHLHPSMTKQFFDVITKVFIGEKGVKIIMTTHSPSTVALAPEESVFIMNKTAPRITKATKDSALRILTSGVPTLSINYENRRQVFVESRHDVTFYEKFYEKLRDKLVAGISINFISSGVGGAGNCEQVKEVVNTLTRYGNRSIYGIIDWDTKNTGNTYVKVLGNDKRYSIENYIFDPILLAAFLVREQYFDKFDKVASGLEKQDRYTDFSDFDDVKLQAIADYIIEKVRLKVGNPTDSELQKSEYVCGKKINLPTWFLRIQGHELEIKIKELFPELNRYRQEGELKKEISNKIIDEIPDFIPMDILMVLKEIQNY
jgi:ABC-type multidrug transport system ATPase subunit